MKLSYPPVRLFDEVFDEFWKTVSGGDGVDCPCCGQRAEVYNRVIYSTNARQLIRLYLKDPACAAWFHARDWAYTGGAGGDYAKMRFWGLIEEQDKRTAETNASGFWRLLPAGRDFVLGKMLVDRHIFVYDNAVVGTEGPPVSIADCLGKHFDYEALMNGTP